jgi:hypothetical protein
MNQMDYQQHLAGPVRKLQIIIAAMLLGTTAFLVLALVLPADMFRGTGTAEDPPIITYVCAAYALIALVGRSALPGVMMPSARARIAQGAPSFGPAKLMKGDLPSELLATDVGKLYGVYATMTIIRGALVEGGALFAGVAFLIEREPLSPVVALVLIIALALLFPTRAGVERWFTEQLRLITQARPPSE